jgi:indolepyruvate ferredoxin oxidoreductase beta subunit
VSARPIRLCIAALGGQGGGVLADWLIGIAEAEGYLVQSTSVPGVAQRTGATIYYLELFPRAEAERAGCEPVMALMPVPGDVDCVVASELIEAGRSVQRGLVTPERTTLIASSHRSYAIAEKSAMGQGMASEEDVVALLKAQARKLVLFDMEAVAERHQSVISSVLLGAICGSGVLPFGKEAFEAAIRRSGIAVATNLAAFAEACERAQRGDDGTPAEAASGNAIPLRARSSALQPLLDRVHRLPRGAQMLALEGARRALDYQDPAYAALYLARLERIAALDAPPTGNDDGSDHALTAAVARGLALWMTFEDTIRVADLKTRPGRFVRVRAEIRAEPGQLFGVTEFMKPRVAEIAGTLPASLGAWMLRSPRVCRLVARFTGGRRIRSSTVSGFVLLAAVAGLRRWRRRTLRYREENARIEAWLARIEQLAASDRGLAVELARAQRLIKGYGETHERGWRNFTTLVAQIPLLQGRPEGAAMLARLHEAALADEDGEALAAQLATLHAAPAPRGAPRRASA